MKKIACITFFSLSLLFSFQSLAKPVYLSPETTSLDRLDEMYENIETVSLTHSVALICVDLLNEYAGIIENNPVVRLGYSDLDKARMGRLMESFDYLGCGG